MAEHLVQILHFANVPSGGSASLAHGLNVADVAKVPDILALDTSAPFNVTGDSVNVTVTNTGSATATVDVMAIYLHSVQRAFGAAGVDSETPNPFVIRGGAGGTFDPSTLALYYDDFVNAQGLVAMTIPASGLTSAVAKVGTGSIVSPGDVTDATAFGQMLALCADGGGGPCHANYNVTANSKIFLAGVVGQVPAIAEWRFQLSSGLPGDSDIEAVVGWTDTPANLLGQTQGAVFECGAVLGNNNWWVTAQTPFGAGAVDTGVAVSGGWQKLRAVMSGGNQQDFYIDGVHVATLNQAITANHGMGCGAVVASPTGGSEGHVIAADYVQMIFPVIR
jgi:hypothetical protein